MIPKELKSAARRNKLQEALDQKADSKTLFNENNKEGESNKQFEIIENTPLKRAKEMYQHCIQKAKLKHSTSSSRAGLGNTSDTSMTVNSSQIAPPNLPRSDSASESECTRINIDLCDQMSQLISPKPLRIKLVWMKVDSNPMIEGGTEKKSKPVFYERMFKIDTKVKGNNFF